MPLLELQIDRHEPYAGGRTFGAHGAYEHLEGRAVFAVDPQSDANREIVDLALAPRDADGRVRFTADVSLVIRAATDGPRRLLVELPNRGRRLAYRTFNRANAEAALRCDPGDGFLFERGFSVCSIGWQWDVYRSETLMALDAPPALRDGRPIRGQTVVEIRPNEPADTWLLANRVHRPYPAADPEERGARLLVREYEDGEDSELPRSAWRFARSAEHGLEPSAAHVTLDGGFEPGKIYHAVYTTEGAPVVGAGLLALREIASFLREPGALNPAAAGFDRVYAFGVSQTGRMLRHLLYLGLNVDERGRRVFDGVLPHVAGGRRGEFNHRFAQPSAQSEPGFGHRFPFADDETVDPSSERREALLGRLRALDAVPRVVYTNSSAEYWRGDGALVHVDPAGDRDVPAAAEVRVYHFAGTQHGAGALPQTRHGAAESAVGRYGFNVVDYSPLLRAALVNLDRWAGEGVEPPPSRHPRVDHGTAVPRERVLARFDGLPGVVTPDRERLWVLRTVDLGPEAERGVGRHPAVEGERYPCLVSDVDEDGNEVAGIRLPDVAVPVATHAGWNLRGPETGAPEQQMAMQGFTRFFARTESERRAAGDPRRPLESRYRDRDAYLELVCTETDRLIADGYVLAGDRELVVGNAAARYDAALLAREGEYTEAEAAAGARG